MSKDGSFNKSNGANGQWSVPDLPPRVLMDLRTDCNLKCPMCIVHGGTDDPRLAAFLKRNTDIEKVRKVMDELMEARPLMMPSLWSEPTLAKSFKEYISGAKERGMSVALYTNGLTVRKKMAEFFVDVGLDSIAFSVDATTPETLLKVRGIDKLKKIHSAVELMLQVRGDSPLPRIGVAFTTQDANRHEEAEFIKFWGPKVDFVRVGELYEDGTFPAIDLPEERTPCPALYNTMPVHVDGNVSYCCLDGFGETNVGNVFKEGVRGVWHGEKLTQVRHYHETGQWDKVPFCKSCDRWASFEFEEWIEDGLLVRKSPEFTYYNRIDKLENWEGSLVGDHKDPQQSLEELGAA